MKMGHESNIWLISAAASDIETLKINQSNQSVTDLTIFQPVGVNKEHNVYP